MNLRRDIISKWKVQLLPSSAYAVSYTAPQASVGFAFESQRGVHSFNSDRRVDFWTRPNSLAFVPEGCAVTSESERGGEYLTFTVPEEYLRTDENALRFNHAISKEAIVAAYELRKALLVGELSDALELEAQLLALLDVVDQVQAGSLYEPPASASMTEARLKRVEELVEAQLSEQISISDLAGCVELSSGFFNRAFKAATGKTPHDYVVERRVARARRLLAKSQKNLSDVAYACGFSSHAHMSSTFKKRLGVTPSQLMIS
ncbi:transcriptional regulator, AraC family [Pseudovibrio denitrificans]|uniref:Transcriptional regulator, AraC family n=1 Tax=Pseudovibrio denitrificans TaxID=258256 RepID=A0A1I7CXX0_9HYPH|nr:AraC family transcriptional regulator [Pseudovibrio denitrificans]SFU04287.1 transcriptional regulator, AraC family [Pseudovibrio denitrificans]